MGASQSDIHNAKIMLVDDEPLNMEVLMTHLEGEGYSNFVSSSDSVGAYDLINETQPDILLLDLMMPEVTGFDILSRLREHEELAYLPVVVLTSSDDSATKLKALQLGATDFLSKPVDASELALRLHNTLAARAYQHQITNFDALTGLPNKDSFRKKFLAALERHESKNGQAGLILANVDRFKIVNDTHGRDVGDAVLYELSLRLQKLFGNNERSGSPEHDHIRQSVYRLEGDKFAVIVPFVSRTEDLVNLVEPAITELAKKYSIEGQNIYLTINFGISVFPGDSSDAEQLMNHAETALLHAKQESSIRYTFYSQELDKKARQMLEIESGLRTALEKKEFFLMYQPKVDVLTGAIVGAEALVRWQHPEHGLVSPDHFVSLAEESGQIVEIGNWVLTEALRQALIWRQTSIPDFKIAVNVSIRQLVESNFTETVNDIIQNSGFPPECLQLELTENMIMENAEDNVEKLNELKSTGVKLSIDDFGTGYSSLSYLQKFPLDELKIDQSFLREVQSPLDSAPIVKAIASLGHDLGMSLVAEGVETHHQLARVKALRIQVYQGYLCSKPLIAEQFGELLNSFHQKAG